MRNSLSDQWRCVQWRCVLEMCPALSAGCTHLDSKPFIRWMRLSIALDAAVKSRRVTHAKQQTTHQITAGFHSRWTLLIEEETRI